MRSLRSIPLATLAIGLCAGQAVANTDSADGKEHLEEIFVYGSQPERYRATDSGSATAFNSEIKDIPRSIQVITEQTILDQQALDLEDTLRNVSGIQSISNFGNTTDSLIIRGFNVRTLFQDGFRLSNNITRIQTANIDRVEVLKGASALLYGQVQPGGLVNVVTKKPQEQARNFISTSFDEHGKRYLLGDFTGTLNSDDTLLYRIVASHEDSETFRETDSAAELKRSNFIPSLTWKISDKDSITAGFEYISAELPVDRGTVLVIDANGNRAIADIPNSRRLDEATDVSDTNQIIFRLDYQHEFNDQLKLESKVRFQDGEADTRDSAISAFGIPSTTLSASPLLPAVSNIILTGSAGADPGINLTGIPAGGQLLRTGFRVESEEKNTYASLRIAGAYSIHQFAVGFDYNARETTTNNSFNTITAAQSGLPLPVPPNTLFLNFSPQDIFNPSYGQVGGELTPNTNIFRDDIQLGIYAQDLMSLSEQWKVLIGVRLDRFERDQNQTQFLDNFPDPALALVARLPANTETKTNSDAKTELSPNLGLVYQPNESLSFYTSYSESFSPNFGIVNRMSGTVENVDPREGQQLEIGAKGSFLDGLVNFNAAFFELAFNNAINGFDATTGAPIINGEEQSSGFELDTTVQFFDGLNLIFNYAYIDAEITKSADNEGNAPLGVSEQSGNLWTTYELTNGNFKGLGFGGGLSYVGSRYIDAANSFKLDGYITADLTMWYFFNINNGNQIRLQAGINNAADEEFYQPAQGSPFDINVGRPRTAYISAAINF